MSKNIGQRALFYCSFAILLLAFLVSTSFPVGAAGACSVPSVEYSSIQAAVDDPSCDEVDVEAGTYRENVRISRDVSVVGDRKGDTIVDGEGAGTVFYIGPGTSVSLSRLVIQNGSALDCESTNGCLGGGVLNEGSALRLTNVVIRNNKAVNGGGVWNGTGEMALRKSTVSDNEGNTVGGIGNLGVLTVQDSVVQHNVAVAFAGLANGNNGQMSIRGSTIRSNQTTGTDWYQNIGGGVTTAGGVTEIRDTIITGNVAGGGAGIVTNAGITTVERSTIQDNYAHNRGGGVLNMNESTLDVRHSQVLNNQATSGGDLYNTQDSIVVLFKTAIGDIYNEDGGQIARQ